MINIDVSVVIQVINFIFLIWVLNLILYKPIRKILLQRKEKVTGLENGIDTFTADAEAKDAAFAAGIKSARTKGLKEKGALLEVAAEEERRIIDKINEKAQADLIAIRQKISQDTDAVKLKLQTGGGWLCRCYRPKNSGEGCLMKICADRRKCWSIIFLLMMVMLLFGFAGIALSSTEGGSGGEHAQVSKGWVATDTYRVMNFHCFGRCAFFSVAQAGC